MELTASTATKQFLERLNRLDFGPIAFQLMNPDDKPGLTLAEATAAIEDYRRFLVLSYLYQDRAIVPSRSVDRVWHLHLLDSQKYISDCMEVLGYVLHHYPYHQASEDAFGDTCQLWKRHFG